jgi:hypothetical protein
MKEREWLTSTNPQTMLEFLQASGKLSERKTRLYAAAVCRRMGLLRRRARQVGGRLRGRVVLQHGSLPSSGVGRFQVHGHEGSIAQSQGHRG